MLCTKIQETYSNRAIKFVSTSTSWESSYFDFERERERGESLSYFCAKCVWGWGRGGQEDGKNVDKIQSDRQD
jgi:hypothetical protein